MNDRLEEIKAWPHYPLVKADEDWLIAEVDRLRATSKVVVEDLGARLHATQTRLAAAERVIEAVARYCDEWDTPAPDRPLRAARRAEMFAALAAYKAVKP